MEWPKFSYEQAAAEYMKMREAYHSEHISLESGYFRSMFQGDFSNLTYPIRSRFVVFMFICKRRGLNRDMRKLLSTFLLNLHVDLAIMFHVQKSDLLSLDHVERVDFEPAERYALSQIVLNDDMFGILLWVCFRRTGLRSFRAKSLLQLGSYYFRLFQLNMHACVQALDNIPLLYQNYGKKHRHMCIMLLQKWEERERRTWVIQQRDYAKYLQWDVELLQKLAREYSELEDFLPK